MGWMFGIVGRLIARLQQPASNSEPFTPNDSTALRDTLRPGDVLLVDCRYASERIGLGYDFKNVIDLMRYLAPWPMTQRRRRRTTTLGSGDASRIICSSLIAQAFDAVRYPILPKITPVESGTARCEIAEIRHSSFYAPRDFDISPYFMVVKPMLARGFNYKDMRWADLPAAGCCQPQSASILAWRPAIAPTAHHHS